MSVQTAATANRARHQTPEMRPASRALGTEVLGLDLAGPIDDTTIATLRKALADTCLLLFRNQRLTPQEHIAFSRRFGELQPHILKDFNMGDHPELFVV